jgi:hypothetical protein
LRARLFEEVIAMLKLLSSLSVLSLLLAACATPPANPGKSTAAVQTPPGCVGQSATRIPVKEGTCAGFGSTYTRQDIDNTGQTTADRALALMDPAVRTGH